jgi:hypothetical protein
MAVVKVLLYLVRGLLPGYYVYAMAPCIAKEIEDNLLSSLKAVDAEARRLVQGEQEAGGQYA